MNSAPLNLSATGTPAATQAAAGGFSFGASPAPAGGFSFGGAPAATTTTAAPTSLGGFSLAPQSTPTSNTAIPSVLGGFLSGSSPALPSPAPFGGFGTTAPAAATGQFTQKPTAAIPSTVTSFAPKLPQSTVGSLAPGSAFTLTSTPNPTASTTGLTLTPSASSAPSFTLGINPVAVASTPSLAPAQTATITSSALSFGLPPASAAAASAAVALTTTTTTTQSSAVDSNNQNRLNFCQLEEHINKWTLELEEQEKMFTNQATQVNAWDRILIENGDKIANLNDAVEKVKAEQTALEQELEFINAQHQELEDCIAPLQKELNKIPQVDVERAQTYLLAESLDTQLKTISEDLKEVIDHLNEANKAQDSNDPMVQIGRILNAHMSSLQWIDSSTSQISTKLDDISKMHETLRRDNERSFRLTYYDQ